VRRAVSLVPSATDIVVALGGSSCLVGLSADCDQPDASTPIPVVTRALIPASLAVSDPAGVDATVRSQLSEGGQLYELDTRAIVALAPEVLFAQDSCSVCALPSSEVVAALRLVPGAECTVVSLDPQDLDAVLSSFSVVGAALGGAAVDAGAALEAASRARLAALGAGGGGVGLGGVTRAARRPRVLVLDWVDPPFVAGNWVPELVMAAGGEPVLAEPGVPSRAVDPTEVASCGADLVVIAPCGLDLAGAREAARSVRGLLGGSIGEVRSEGVRVEGVRVVAFDGRVWFSRPGPRLVEGAEALAAWLSGGRPAETISIDVTEDCL
jgi:iron complex transport system substrate-binding protein